MQIALGTWMEFKWMHKFYVHFSAFTISLSIDVKLFFDNYCIINNYFLWLIATQIFMSVNVLKNKKWTVSTKTKIRMQNYLEVPLIQMAKWWVQAHVIQSSYSNYRQDLLCSTNLEQNIRLCVRKEIYLWKWTHEYEK